MLKDEAAILDMVQAVQRALSYGEGLTKAELKTNHEKQSAILYQILIIGEAVKRLSVEYRTQHPEVPWKAIAGMRDVLAHQYDTVDLETIWDVLHEELPVLLSSLEQLLPQKEP
jgi:uncharacterized protein with HEPN domain